MQIYEPIEWWPIYHALNAKDVPLGSGLSQAKYSLKPGIRFLLQLCWFAYYF